MLVSSHLLSEVAQSVDDVVVISHGTLRASGTLASVLGSADGPVTRVRAADRRRARGGAAAAGDVGHRARASGALIVTRDAPEAVGRVATEERIALAELVAVSRSLEDAFFELTEGEAA